MRIIERHGIWRLRVGEKVKYSVCNERKQLYIWKGENVPRNLQNHIPIIEEQILEFNPHISILRHFTIEGVKDETIEFLDLLKINQEDFKKQLEEWDNFRERMLSSIKMLQNEIEEHYANKEFREIQIKAKNIIYIAEKIQDNDIINEQEKNIQQIKEKLAEEEIESLKEEETERLKEEETEPLKEEETEPLKEEETEPLKEEEAEPLIKEETKPMIEENMIIENENNDEENIINELESGDYNQLLRRANLIESRSPNETKKILEKCLDIIIKDREKFIEENPKRMKDEVILEKRI